MSTEYAVVRSVYVSPGRHLARRKAADSMSPNSVLGTVYSERIVLVGYRCTGKTTVARLLAERLGWDWVDADSVLEARAGRSIREVFATEGEAAFRAHESAGLVELCQRRRHVIATGGGIVLTAENRQRLRQAGWVIWLTADAATLWQRLQQDATTAERRPNLTVGGLVEIEELLHRREPLYRACADVQIDTAGRSPEQVAELILAAWSARTMDNGRRTTDDA
jgi:shikimate kinase